MFLPYRLTKIFPTFIHTPNFVLKAYMWLTFHYSFTCLRMPQEHSLCIGWFSLYPSTYSVPCHTVWTQYLSTDEIGKSIHWNPSAECQPIHPSATTSCPNCLPSAADTPWALRISAYQYLNLPTHKLPRGHQIHSILCWLSPNCLLLSVALRTILIWSSLPSLYSSQTQAFTFLLSSINPHNSLHKNANLIPWLFLLKLRQTPLRGPLRPFPLSHGSICGHWTALGTRYNITLCSHCLFCLILIQHGSMTLYLALSNQLLQRGILETWVLWETPVCTAMVTSTGHLLAFCSKPETLVPWVTMK